MTRASLGTINPATTSGTQLAALLSNRDTAENSGHAGTGRPSYATAGMIYTENSGSTARLFLAVGVSGPDIDLSALFADRPGTIRTTAEVRLAAGWLWCDGAAQPRVTYPDLFNNICPAFTGTVTLNSLTITAVSEDLRFEGLIGAKIEGSGIGAGVTITAVGVNTLTMSVVAIGTASATPLRLFPHGNGNGSTTFNVPNAKGRLIIGRQDMGGTDAGLINVGGSGIDATRLAASGGAQAAALTIANLPLHTHPVSVSGSASVSTAPDHSHAFSGGTTDAQGAHAHGPSGPGTFVTYQGVGGNAFTIGGGTRSSSDGSTNVAGAHAHNIVGASLAPAGTHSHIVTLTLGASSSSPVGAAATPLPNMPPSIVENVVIKF